MTENNKWIKIAIVIIAVVVIVESVVILTRKAKAPNTVVNNPTVQLLPSRAEPVINLKVNGTTTEMKLKNSYKLWVEMTPKRQMSIDAIDLYVKYDKAAFTVAKLDFSGMTVKPTVSKISDKRNVIVVNYFITETQGLILKNGEMVKLLGFEVTPKKTGNYSFEISTGDNEGLSKTMVVENKTSSELPFDVSKFNISVR